MCLICCLMIEWRCPFTDIFWLDTLVEFAFSQRNKSHSHMLSHSVLLCFIGFGRMDVASPNVFLLASVRTPVTSRICSGCSHCRSPPSLFPSPTICSAHSWPTGPRWAGCGLGLSTVISSAWRLWSGVDRIWISYRHCYIIGRNNARPQLSLFPLKPN